MKNILLVRRAWVLALCLFPLLVVLPGSAEGNPPSGQTASSSASSKQPATKTAVGTPSAADIAAAKASGKVWVNLSTGIYHRGGRWYGKTKDGKFMTVDEAKKAGYKPAKRD